MVVCMLSGYSPKTLIQEFSERMFLSDRHTLSLLLNSQRPLYKWESSFEVPIEALSLVQQYTNFIGELPNLDYFIELRSDTAYNRGIPVFLDWEFEDEYIE